MARLGRKPQGAALVKSLGGSDHAKRRMMLFLQTLADECSVVQACQELGLSQSRFFAHRADWLQQALEVLEPQSPGRPAKPEPSAPPAEVAALRQRVRELEAVLPHVCRRLRPLKKSSTRARAFTTSQPR